MIGSFYNGLSGAKTYQFGIDSWSNNIANINTTGFKGNSPEFKTVFADTMSSSFHTSVTSNIGHGTTMGSNALIKSNGELELSDDEFDLGITDEGYFVVGPKNVDDINNAYFTRNGDFHRDEDGYIVNNQGHYLYGIDLGKIDESGVFNANAGDDDDLKAVDAELSPLRIPEQVYYRPNLTTEASLSLNLNAQENYKAIDAVFKDNEGNFDLETFRAQDMNALGSKISGENMPYMLNNQSSIEIQTTESSFIAEDNDPADIGVTTTEDGDSITTVTRTAGITTTETTTTTTLEYGVDFTTVGEFMDAVEEATGTTAYIEDPDNPDYDACRFHFKQGPMDDNMSKNIKFDTNVATLLEATGIPANIDMYSNSEIVSNIVNVPTYSTTTNIYDESGTKHIIFAEYYLQSKDDLNNEDDSETWNYSAGVYNKDGSVQISNEIKTGSIVFNGSQVAAETEGYDPIELEFFDNTVSFDPLGRVTKDGEIVATTQNSDYMSSQISKTEVDGTEEGFVESISIDNNGLIHFNFTNFKYETFGRVGIANFINEQGLNKIDSTTFETINVRRPDGTISTASGEPRLMWDWTGNNDPEGGRIALSGTSIVQKRLETSNILMATALTELMISQRAYSANAKSITTADELIQQAIQLKK